MNSFNMTVGLGAGYLSIESSAGSGDTAVKSKNTVIDVLVPVYASYDMDFFAVYAVPKYNLRYISSSSSGSGSSGGSTTSGGGSGAAHLTGATGGVKIGSTWGLYLETTYMMSLAGSFDLLQVNAAVFF